MQKSRLSDLVLISAAPALLLLGLIFDALMRSMTPPETSAVALTSRQAYLYPMFELLLMLAVVVIIWMLVASRNFSRLVPAVYLVLGVVFLYAFALYFTAFLPESFSFIALYLTPGTYIFQASGALAAMGLVLLWFWKAPQPAPVVPSQAPFAAPVFPNETTNDTNLHEHE